MSVSSLLPSKLIVNRLIDLYNHALPSENKDKIYISFENENHSRSFFIVSIDELLLLVRSIPTTARCSYECIPSDRHVRGYIDFEYPMVNNMSVNIRKGIECCLKVLFISLHLRSQCYDRTYSSMSEIANRFLVLDA
jgi:hypothetical protein